MIVFSWHILEEELLANLEDTYLPVHSVTPGTPSKQPAEADAPPLARSVGSAKSFASSATFNSDRQRLEGLLKSSSLGVTPHPVASTGSGETASTSEVSYSELNPHYSAGRLSARKILFPPVYSHAEGLPLDVLLFYQKG